MELTLHWASAWAYWIHAQRLNTQILLSVSRRDYFRTTLSLESQNPTELMVISWSNSRWHELLVPIVVWGTSPYWSCFWPFPVHSLCYSIMIWSAWNRIFHAICHIYSNFLEVYSPSLCKQRNFSLLHVSLSTIASNYLKNSSTWSFILKKHTHNFQEHHQ